MNTTNGSGGQGTFGTPLTQLFAAGVTVPPLVDPYGRPVSVADASAYGPPTDQLKDVTAAAVVHRDIPIVALTRWTATSIRDALDAHMMGRFDQSSFLCDAMTGDDRVSATLGQRMGSLFSRPMKTTPCVNGVESDDAEAVKVAEAFDAAWERMAPLAVLEEIHTWGITEGVVPIEIQWDRTVTPWQPYFKPWHPTHLLYRWDIRKYQIITMDGVETIEPGDGRWILYTPHGPYRGWRRGAVRALATPWLFRQMLWRDWARYNERHGLPILKATAPARSDPTLRNNFVQGLANLGQESVVLCPQNVDGTGYDVSMVEAKDRSYESFDKSMGRADMAIVLAILWQNLTTEVAGGSYAAATVHEGVKQTAARYDNATLSSCIFEQAARPFAAWNFGRPDLAPRKTWVIEEPADHLSSAQTFSAFSAAINSLRAGGIKVTVDGVAALAFSFNLPLSVEQIQEVAVAAVAVAQVGKKGNKGGVGE